MQHMKVIYTINCTRERGTPIIECFFAPPYFWLMTASTNKSTTVSNNSLEKFSLHSLSLYNPTWTTSINLRVTSLAATFRLGNLDNTFCTLSLTGIIQITKNKAQVLHVFLLSLIIVLALCFAFNDTKSVFL